MLFGEMLDDERKAGREEGMKAGREAGAQMSLALAAAMIADNRVSDLPKLQTDAAFFEEMLKLYEISAE